MKIIVTGSLNSQKAIDKINQIHSKTPFDLCLVCGSCCEGTLSLPTYNLCGSTKSSTFLGNFGTLNTGDITIGYCAENPTEEALNFFLNFKGKLDLFLTVEWPSGINQKSKLFSQISKSISGSRELTEICSFVKPRYHFASGKNHLFFEREPYYNIDGPPTRFIGLSYYGNPDKERWFYAFNIMPFSEADQKLQGEITESPFSQSATNVFYIKLEFFFLE